MASAEPQILIQRFLKQAMLSIVVCLLALPATFAVQGKSQYEVATTASTKDSQIKIAVATNFFNPLNDIVISFNTRYPKAKVRISAGSTGKIYAQILAGAKFDLFLAADQHRPNLLKTAGLATHTKTYAIGSLSLVGADSLEYLTNKNYRRLAIANPKLAPYGEAAVQTLNALKLYPWVQSRLVLGENVGQAVAMVATGNAEVGLLATSALTHPRISNLPHVSIPINLYQPIKQDLAVLGHTHSVYVRKFLKFLESSETLSILKEYGYEFDATASDNGDHTQQIHVNGFRPHRD